VSDQSKSVVIELQGLEAFDQLIKSLKVAAKNLDQATGRKDRLTAADKFDSALDAVKHAAQAIRGKEIEKHTVAGKAFAESTITEVRTRINLISGNAARQSAFRHELGLALHALASELVSVDTARRTKQVRSGSEPKAIKVTETGKVNWNAYLDQNHGPLAAIRGTGSAHALAHAYLPASELLPLCGADCETIKSPRFVKGDAIGYARQK
jgi:hypothetical protein